MLEMNPAEVEKVLVLFSRDAVHKNGFANGLVGVSGGLDSAVVLNLASRALGKEHTFALLMPYRTSAPESLEHAKKLCTSLGVASDIVDITPQIDAYFQARPSTERNLLGNKCARERMAVLYDFSARKKALVVGTSNKSELLIGYSTLWGDSAAAFQPIGDLYKTQVFTLAEHLGIPAEIRSKVPTADLWPGQSDEGEIGLSYRDLDQILYLLVDAGQNESEIAAQGFAPETIRRVQQMIVASQFKRTMPPVCKLQPRTIGIDFRYPRDWNK